MGKGKKDQRLSSHLEARPWNRDSAETMTTAAGVCCLLPHHHTHSLFTHSLESFLDRPGALIGSQESFPGRSYRQRGLVELLGLREVERVLWLESLWEERCRAVS